MTGGAAWPDDPPRGLRASRWRMLRDHGGAAHVLPGYLRCLARRRGLLLSEYLALGLDTRPLAEARRYIGAYWSARLTLQINRVSNRRGLVADKLLFDGVLRGHGLCAPGLVAVFGRPAPPGAARIGSEDDLRRLLAGPGVLPLFGKPAMGQRSQDALSLAGFDADADVVVTPAGGRIPVADVIDQLRRHHRGTGYLFQPHLQQHPDIAAAVGPTVGTVRVITLRLKERVHFLHTFWKIPRAGTIADMMWRGNLIAGIDAATGQVGPVLDAMDVGARAAAEHPDTGAPLQGRVLPDWDRLKVAARKAAGLVHVIPLIGWDIAMGADGPVIVEANSSPSLDVPQFLTGEGALAGRNGELLAQALSASQVERGARRARRRGRRKALFRDRIGRG